MSWLLWTVLQWPLCVCVKSLYLCLTLCNPIDCSPPGSSVHGVILARILEWVFISSSRGSSQPRDRTRISCIGRWIFTTEPLSREAQKYISFYFESFFPDRSVGKESSCNARDTNEFNPWIKKIPWRREWQPTPVFLPGKPHGQRSLVGYSPWGCKESDLATKQKQQNMTLWLNSNKKAVWILLISYIWHSRM